LALIALIGAAMAQPVDKTYGYCDTWTGGECAAWMTGYNTNVFFYTPAVPKDQQRAQLASSLTTLSQFAGIASGQCGTVLMPFVCANLFTPCLQYNNAAINMTIRQPTCQSVCLDVHVKCQILLNNPLVKAQLNAVPQLVPFLYCNSTDPYTDNLPSFPDAPGYDILGQAVPCSSTLPTAAAPGVAPQVAPAVAPAVASGNAPAVASGNSPAVASGNAPAVTPGTQASGVTSGINNPVNSPGTGVPTVNNNITGTAGIKVVSLPVILVSALVAVLKFM
jgi:hypothetical protein